MDFEKWKKFVKSKFYGYPTSKCTFDHSDDHIKTMCNDVNPSQDLNTNVRLWNAIVTLSNMFVFVKFSLLNMLMKIPDIIIFLSVKIYI